MKRTRTPSAYAAMKIPVSVFSISDAGDLDGVFLLKLEEEAVIATAEAEAGARRLEFLRVSRAGGQIVVNTVRSTAKR